MLGQRGAPPNPISFASGARYVALRTPLLYVSRFRGLKGSAMSDVFLGVPTRRVDERQSLR